MVQALAMYLVHEKQLENCILLPSTMLYFAIPLEVKKKPPYLVHSFRGSHFDIQKLHLALG